MDAIFKKYKVKVKLPENSLLYKTDEIVKALNLSQEQAMNCQIVLGDRDSDSITSISFLGIIENVNDFAEVLNVFVKSNENVGLRLETKEKQKIDSGDLYILKFDFQNDKVLNIFICLNNQIFMSNTNCKAENLEKAELFAKEVMSSIAYSE